MLKKAHFTNVHTKKCINRPSKLLCDVSQTYVDPKLWASFKDFSAQRAVRLLARVPEALDARLAEIVPTLDGDWIFEEIQTDAAPELFSSQNRRHVLVGGKIF